MEFFYAIGVLWRFAMAIAQKKEVVVSSEQDEINAIEKADEDAANEELPSEMPPADMVSFSEARSCHELVRLHERGKLIIQPNFQRDFVWPVADQTRFVDSLAKQLPIPSMCIGLDYKSETYQVIDGLQRISTIIKFLTDNKWRMAKVAGVDSRIAGNTPEKIEAKYSKIYSRIEDTLLPVTLIRHDPSNAAHRSYIFNIFHRLNSGGRRLTAQEIRNCIYAGRFNELLRRMVRVERVVRALFGIREGGASRRFRDEEMLLRFFAFAETYKDYKGSMTKHLNEYMHTKSGMSEAAADAAGAKMLRVVELIYGRILGKQAWNKSRAVMEAVAVGVYCHLEKLEKMGDDALRGRYEALLSAEPFLTKNMSSGIGSRESVIGRISKGVEIFGR